MIRIYHATVPFDFDAAEKWIFSYFSRLSPFFHERLIRFKRSQDRLTFMVGKILLAKGFREFGFDDTLFFTMRPGAHNRPEVSESIDFNIAHSENHVVCVVSDTHRVGVDIEVMRDLPLSQYLSVIPPKIRQVIETAENPVMIFFKYWTMLEAALKADGRGMDLPFSEVRLLQDRAMIKSRSWYLREIELSSGTISHLATSHPPIELSVDQIRLPEDDLLFGKGKRT